MVCDFQDNFWNYLYPATPDLFRNQLGLDAGCGFGRHIYHAAACGAESDADGALRLARLRDSAVTRCMKITLLTYLACPACGGALQIAGGGSRPDDADIQEGTLACGRCVVAYPIVRGIPRFPLAEEASFVAVTRRTQSRYTFTWQHFGEPAVNGQWEKDSYHYSSMIPRELTSGDGKVGLDAGCGAGHDLVRMAQGRAQVIGFDLSEGVETAYRLTRHLTNVHIVQGDLNRPPFRPSSFDFVYSFGVLHHLPDPLRGFTNLSRLLKRDAPLITYLYEDFSNRSRVERFLIRAVREIRRVTSRLPTGLLYGLCWLATPFVWTSCSLPAYLLRPLAPRFAGRIPFRHTVRWPVLASDLFDRFAPPIEWRYSRDSVVRLYHEVGLAGVETYQYRGWVSWGFKRDDSFAAGKEDVGKALLGQMVSD